MFSFIWNKIELIQNFRAFSRINILLIPLISILICFAIKNLIENKVNIKSSMIILFISFLIILIQVYLIEIVSAKSGYWTAWQEKGWTCCRKI